MNSTWRRAALVISILSFHPLISAAFEGQDESLWQTQAEFWDQTTKDAAPPVDSAMLSANTPSLISATAVSDAGRQEPPPPRTLERSYGQILLRWPWNLVKTIGLSVFEIAREIPTAVVIAIKNAVDGKPEALLIQPLEAAANTAWNSVSAVVGILDVLSFPLYGALDPVSVEYEGGWIDGHLFITGGAANIFNFNVDAYTFSELMVFENSRILSDYEILLRHEHAHTDQFRRSFVADMIIDYAIRGRAGHPLEKAAEAEESSLELNHRIDDLYSLND